jgi:hypothetical protein
LEVRKRTIFLRAYELWGYFVKFRPPYIGLFFRPYMVGTSCCMAIDWYLVGQSVSSWVHFNHFAPQVRKQFSLELCVNLENQRGPL